MEPNPSPESTRFERSWISERTVFGLFLVALGFLIWFDRTGWVEGWTRFWPLLPIALGVVKLLLPRHPGQRIFGGILILVFGALQLRNLGWIDFRIDRDLIVPAVFVLIGLRMIFVRHPWRSRRDRWARRTTRDPQTSGDIDAVAVLGSREVISSATHLRGGDAMAILGACTLDLRNAKIPAGEVAVVDAFAFWGGVDIVVPESWEVDTQGIAVLAAFEDRTMRPAQPEARLVVKGFALMGGVEVKNRSSER